jgi:hypothetical protein
LNEGNFRSQRAGGLPTQEPRGNHFGHTREAPR